MRKYIYLFTILIIIILTYFLINQKQGNLVIYADLESKTEDSINLDYVVEQAGPEITYYKFKKPYNESGSLRVKDVEINIPKSINFLDDEFFENKYVTVEENDSKYKVYFGFTEGCIGQNVCSYLSYSEIKNSNIKLLEQELLDSLKKQRIESKDNADFLKYLNRTKIENFTFENYETLFYKTSCGSYCPAGVFYVQAKDLVLKFESKSFIQKEDVAYVFPMIEDLLYR